jgi:5-formyltetrahydrofolate cyclo-ligase
MAVPRLADALLFLLDPASLTVPPEEAASSHVAEIVARKVGVEEMQPADLVICGSVAVNRLGVRLGKGRRPFRPR